jgi:hypothetical protein
MSCLTSLQGRPSTSSAAISPVWRQYGPPAAGGPKRSRRGSCRPPGPRQSSAISGEPRPRFRWSRVANILPRVPKHKYRTVPGSAPTPVHSELRFLSPFFSVTSSRYSALSMDHCAIMKLGSRECAGTRSRVLVLPPGLSAQAYRLFGSPILTMVRDKERGGT